MSAKREITFTILPDGNVELTVTGLKGKQCLPVADLFGVLGTVTVNQATADYYAPDDDEERAEVRTEG